MARGQIVESRENVGWLPEDGFAKPVDVEGSDAPDRVLKLSAVLCKVKQVPATCFINNPLIVFETNSPSQCVTVLDWHLQNHKLSDLMTSNLLAQTWKGRKSETKSYHH